MQMQIESRFKASERLGSFANSRTECVVVREDCGAVAAGEELVRGLAADGNFLPGFDDCFDALQRDVAEAADQNIR